MINVILVEKEDMCYCGFSGYSVHQLKSDSRQILENYDKSGVFWGPVLWEGHRFIFPFFHIYTRSFSKVHFLGKRPIFS